MSDTEQGIVEEAAAPAVPGVAVAEKPAEVEEIADDSPTVTISQRKLDQAFGKVRAEGRQQVQELQSRLHQLETKPAAPATPAQAIPTLEQVQTLYDRGQLTEQQKDQWLVYHAEERANQRLTQTITQVASLTRAQATTDTYMKAMPTLSDTGSEDFKALAMTYAELMGKGRPHSVETQADALRMTFGPLTRLKEKESPSPEHTRQRADTFLEGAGGGGRMASETNPLKDVPERQIAYWKKQGYTKAQMVQEAPLQGVRTLGQYRRLTKVEKKK